MKGQQHGRKEFKTKQEGAPATSSRHAQPQGEERKQDPATLAGEARLGGSDACQTGAKTRATLRHIRVTATRQGARQVLPTQTPASPELSQQIPPELSEGGIAK